MPIPSERRGAVMLRLLYKSTLLTIAIIFVGQIVSFSSRMALGQEFTPFLFMMNCLLPAVTGFPAAFLVFWTHQKSERAYAQLEEAHLDLATAHAELAMKSRYDALTGLLNREALFADLTVAQLETTPGALLMIDADNFKQVNDQFGHAEGDVALRLIANCLADAAGQLSLVGRIGGEEFSIFVPGVTGEEAFLACERIREAVAAMPFFPAFNLRHSLSVSVGVALTGIGFGLQQSLRHADASLYSAKEMGRNTVVFNDFGVSAA